jgi:WS/DGAT/MGAT family acyltransferase
MEDPTNLMMPTGVLIFHGPMDWQRLKAVIRERLLRFDRFRQRVTPSERPLETPYWEDDPKFNLSNHLKRIKLPPPGDQTVLQEVVSTLMSTPLDYARPLWQMHFIEGYGEGGAVVSRLHHSIADGIALMQVLLSLADAAPDAPVPGVPPQPALNGHEPRHSTLHLPRLPGLKAAERVAETLVHEGLEALFHPSHALDLARIGTKGTTAFGKLVLRYPDPKTVFKGPLGVAKRAAWSGPVPLREVKTIGQAMGGTVNDVLLTAVAGALRRYLLARGEEADGLDFRAVVPVNLRRPDEEFSLGNKFSLIFLSLPVGIADPVERLRELKRRMDDIKGSSEAAVAFGILNAIGMTPGAIQDLVVDIFGTKATGVMTNVPGPREKLYLAGTPLDTIMFWVPQAGHLGLGVSIISYAGQVRLGIATDAGLVPDPETIAAAFHAEFEALGAWVREKHAGRSRALQPMMQQLDEAIKSLEDMLDQPDA